MFVVLLGIHSALFSAGLDPQVYSKNSQLQLNWATQALQKYPWQGNERILDIGCGDGKVTAAIAQNFTRAPVLGLDISPAMIAFASKSFPADAYPNLIYLEGDIRCLPFHGQFDLIVSFCSMIYVLEQEKGFQSICDSLRPGGSFLCVVPAKIDANLMPVSEKLVQSEKWAPYFPSFKRYRAYYTQQEYAELIDQAGMEPIYFSSNPDPIRFPSQTALIDWLRPLLNYASHLSADLKEEFLLDLSNEILKFGTLGEDGSFSWESNMLEFFCRKKLPLN